jgi:hypothetical protein
MLRYQNYTKHVTRETKYMSLKLNFMYIIKIFVGLNKIVSFIYSVNR